MTTINETKDALRQGLCTLVYEKLDGEMRTAIGTLNSDFIPVRFTPKNTGHPNVDLVSYFDVDRQGWRSFWPERLRSLSLV